MASRKPRTSIHELNSHLSPLIMAGGNGTRLGPISRQWFPKQLLRITGEDTLIQQTMHRVISASAPNRVLISTNPAQAEFIRVQSTRTRRMLGSATIAMPIASRRSPHGGLRPRYSGGQAGEHHHLRGQIVAEPL